MKLLFNSMPLPRILLRVSIVFLFLCSLPELLLSATVTLGSIEIYKTHEWIASEPTVYFLCKGENKTVLPDVKKTNTKYNFKGEESWQPMTEFTNRKCKRCGFYEEDTIKSDDVFDEWEFCPDDFMATDGKYTRIKDKEFNATFLCQECVPSGRNESNNTEAPHKEEEKGMPWVLIIVVSIVTSAIFVAGLVAGLKYWQKRRRQREQARFLKLFEDGDDIEDELGIGPLSDTL